LFSESTVSVEFSFLYTTRSSPDLAFKQYGSYRLLARIQMPTAATSTGSPYQVLAGWGAGTVPSS
jgi:hypothetical protein